MVGAPDEWTYLRIAQRGCGQEECYTAYTSRNGSTWVHGGTWTYKLGTQARIGLVSMGGAGFTANFDYVRVYHLADRDEKSNYAADANLEAEPLSLSLDKPEEETVPTQANQLFLPQILGNDGK